jgi:hypothetical protein
MTRGLVLVAAALLLAGAARAAPAPRVLREAQARVDRANHLYNEGRYAEALRLYQAAYDLVPSPDILFNIGLAREKTFDYEGCAVALTEYLRQPGDAEQLARARERLARCRARTLVPVKVSSLPPSAAIYVGQGARRVLRGRTPTRLDLPPGTYLLTLEAPGYQPQSQQVTAEVGARPEVDFTLERTSSLRIEADVAGARVALNGRYLEETPFQREVPAGLYQVAVSKPGHRPVTREVRVEPGQHVALMLSLPRVRILSLTSATPAQVRLDGRAAGTTPVVAEVAAGPHQLEASAPGHLPLVTDIRVGQESDLALQLELSRRRSRRQTAVVLGLAAVAVSAAVVGVVFGSLALVDEHRYRTGVPTVALADEGRARARVADAMWLTAGAAAVVTGVYYLVTRPRRSGYLVKGDR